MLGNVQQSISFQLSEVSGSTLQAALVLKKLYLHSVTLLQPLGSSSDFLPAVVYLEAVEPLQVPWIQPPVSSKSSSAPGRWIVDLMAGAD